MRLLSVVLYQFLDLVEHRFRVATVKNLAVAFHRQLFLLYHLCVETDLRLKFVICCVVLPLKLDVHMFQPRR